MPRTASLGVRGGREGCISHHTTRVGRRDKQWFIPASLPVCRCPASLPAHRVHTADTGEHERVLTVLHF